LIAIATAFGFSLRRESIGTGADVGRAQTVWEEPMGSESGISMIPAVKPGHPHRSDRRQHRLAILKGT
jgi:hypothetical protein